MKKIIPFNNIVLCQLLDKEPAKKSGIIMPNSKEGRFIRIKVLDKGSLVHIGIKISDVCIANNLFELIDPLQPDIGFINERDILGKEI